MGLYLGNERLDSFNTKFDIRANFKSKDRARKHQKQWIKLAGAITKTRANRLDCSFGKNKGDYHPKRIRAPTRARCPIDLLHIYKGNHRNRLPDGSHGSGKSGLAGNGPKG